RRPAAPVVLGLPGRLSPPCRNVRVRGFGCGDYGRRQAMNAERFKAQKAVRIRTAEGRCASPEVRAEAAAALKRWMLARGYMTPAQAGLVERSDPNREEQ